MGRGSFPHAGSYGSKVFCFFFSKKKRLPSFLTRPLALALVAGWVDAVGYLQAGTFAGAMSGNTILLGLSVGQGRWALAAWQGGTVAAFLGGTMVARLLSRWEHSPVAATLAAAVLVLLAAWLGHMPRDLLLLALGMGLLNAASTKYGDASLNTSVITGNLVKLADAVAERVLPVREPKQPADMVVAVPGVWLCYAGGAVLAVLARPWLERAVPGWDAALLPAAVALPLTLLLR